MFNALKRHNKYEFCTLCYMLSYLTMHENVNDFNHICYDCFLSIDVDFVDWLAASQIVRAPL